MSKCTFRNGTVIGDYHTPYIVAEVNSSHNGDFDTAKKMIDAAKESGCSCVKFQSWSAQSLYSKTFYNTNPIAKRMVSKFSFYSTQLKELADYCFEVGIHFSSTPYSREEVDCLIDEYNAPFIKVASMDINNYPFLEYIAQRGVPIVLSTGMSDMEEIRRAVRVVESTGNENLCLLHCISIYPPKISTIRLMNILGLREEFPEYPIGFSDHSLGIEMSIAATALGSALIEKHLTLDHKKIGMDNQMATEPDEMKKLVLCCKNVCVAMGDKKRLILDDEIEQRAKMRRSVIVKRDMKVGEMLTLEDMDAKRPAIGYPPEKINELVGKTITKDILADEIIVESNISTHEF